MQWMHQNSLENDSKRLIGIAFFVAVMHLGLFLGFGLFEQANPPKPKPANKVVVKTVKLAPIIKPEVKPEVLVEPLPAPEIIPEAPPAIAEERIEEILPELIAEPIPEPIPEPLPEVIPETPKEPEPAPPPPKVIEKPSPKPKLVKKTAPLSPSKPKEAAKPAPKKAPVKKEAPKKPPKVIKKTTPKPDPQKAALQKKRKELIMKAQESVAKIDLKGNKIVAASGSLDQVKLPQTMGELKVDSLTFDEPDSALSVRERGYRDELAHRLKLLLKLPEKGIVKLKLTLERSGKVLKVEVTGAESKKNRQHIEKALPALQFPPFGDNFESASQYTFQINLKSD